MIFCTYKDLCDSDSLPLLSACLATYLQVEVVLYLVTAKLCLHIMQALLSLALLLVAVDLVAASALAV